jgi:hypothetical protein
LVPSERYDLGRNASPGLLNQELRGILLGPHCPIVLINTAAIRFSLWF